MLKERLSNDLKSAMKEGRSFEVGVLRLLNAALQSKEIEKRGKGGEGVLMEDEAMAVLRAEAKKRKDAVLLYEQGGRNDLKENEEKELRVIEKYLPAAASAEEVERAVAEAISKINPQGMKDMGRVIAAAMKKLDGRAEGSAVSDLVKKKLSA